MHYIIHGITNTFFIEMTHWRRFPPLVGLHFRLSIDFFIEFAQNDIARHSPVQLLANIIILISILIIMEEVYRIQDSCYIEQYLFLHPVWNKYNLTFALWYSARINFIEAKHNNKYQYIVSPFNRSYHHGHYCYHKKYSILYWNSSIADIFYFAYNCSTA